MPITKSRGRRPAGALVGAQGPIHHPDVVGANHAMTFDVDHLLVEHIPLEQHLALAAVEGMQVDVCRIEMETTTIQPLDLIPGDVERLPVRPRDQSRHGRIGTSPDANDQVAKVSDPFAGILQMGEPMRSDR